MNRRIATSGRQNRGFTVIEILIAVTIFSLVAIVIFSVFRTAVRTQATAQRETEMLERSRFVMDSLDRDFTNIFFRDETAYNVTVSNMIEKMEQERLRAEETGDWTQFEAQFGKVDDSHRDSKDEENADPSIGNPYEKGRIIDLQFKAQDGGKTDKINFAIADRLGSGTPYQPWGLGRVEYSVDKGWLMRREQTVETEKRDLRGESKGLPTPPRVTKLAEGIEEFDLSFAFWFDNTWYEIDSWESSNRQIRNARQILGTYESEELQQTGRNDGENAPQNAEGGTIRPGDPGWNEYLNDLDSEPLDRLPAYIRVRLVLAAPESPTRKYTFQRIFRIGMAEETWVPGRELKEDQRESEQTLRDDKFRRIRPGVTRPK